jgi:hypothetical protein
MKPATHLIPYVLDFTDSRLKTSEWVGPVIVTFLTLHNFNLDHTAAGETGGAQRR